MASSNHGKPLLSLSLRFLLHPLSLDGNFSNSTFRVRWLAKQLSQESAFLLCVCEREWQATLLARQLSLSLSLPVILLYDDYARVINKNKKKL